MPRKKIFLTSTPPHTKQHSAARRSVKASLATLGALRAALTSRLLRRAVFPSVGGVLPVDDCQIAVTGSRRLGAEYAPLVARVATSASVVLVGDAAGADAFARAAAGPRARVFRAASRRPGQLAARSIALVRAAAAAGAPLVGFVCAPAPAGLVPSPSPARCFCGLGSGSWASLALAAGLGLPVFVFWCAPGAPVLPPWGAWSCVSAGPLAGAWSLAPAPVQLALF